MNQYQTKHGIVIGASIAGLLAARVLSDHFARVTIIERDELPDMPVPRRGVPQSHHIHILLRRGLLALEQFFPGFGEQLSQAGAPAINWSKDMAFFTRVGRAPKASIDLITLTSSRGLIEHLLRQRVANLPGVNLLSRTEALHLLSDETNRRVMGIRVRYREGELRGQEASLPADLVVDASGRSSRNIDWLTALGYEAPPEIKVQSFTGYASREYAPSPDFTPDWKVLMIRDQPPYGTRGGVIFPIEAGRWIVNIAGAGKEAPPTDEAGFIEFTQQLLYPGFCDALEHAQPLSRISGYQRTENHLKRFDQMKRWLGGFVAIGDAVCSFNPLYGQGMTVAALEAFELDRWLRAGGDSLSFQKRVASTVRTPWLIAVNEDMHLPDTIGAASQRFEAIFQGYIDQIQWLAYSDPVVLSVYMQVSHMIKPPAALFSPGIAMKVIGRLVQPGNRNKPDW